MRTRVLTAGFVIGAVAVLGAHVTIGPTESRQGARERYTVRVPTEGAVATVAVDLEIPEGVRVTNVLAGGWSTKLRREANRIVGVTWTMEIPAAHFAEFVFNARNPGEATEITWGRSHSASPTARAAGGRRRPGLSPQSREEPFVRSQEKK